MELQSRATRRKWINAVVDGRGEAASVSILSSAVEYAVKGR